MFVRQIVNVKVGFPNSSEQYTKILGMLRRLTYISRFFDRTPYVVPSAVRPKATCRVAQARISLTSVEELYAMLRNVPVYLFCAGQSTFDWTRSSVELCECCEGFLSVMYLGTAV
jgi:hypothetical protein